MEQLIKAIELEAFLRIGVPKRGKLREARLAIVESYAFISGLFFGKSA